MVNEQVGEEKVARAARVSMLRMAKAWQTSGAVNQAIDAYSRVLARYPSSREASAAVEAMLGLATIYEREGHYRLALSLHEKLEQMV